MRLGLCKLEMTNYSESFSIKVDIYLKQYCFSNYKINCGIFLFSRDTIKTYRLGKIIMKPFSISIVICMIFIFTVNAIAQPISNPTSFALGDAYITKASGVQALYWNPAKLGIIENPFTISLLQSNFSVYNNAFSLAYYNDITGKYLSEDDKKELLDKIPESGFELNGNFGTFIPCLALSYKNYAIAFSIIGAGYGNFSKNYFDLLLNGNEWETVYDFKDNDAEAALFGEIKLGYGKELNIEKLKEFFVIKDSIPPIYAGLNLGILHGYNYAEITNFEGHLYTKDTGFFVDNNIEYRTCAGGNGLRFDVGLFSQITHNISIGLTVNNIFGFIHWNKDCKSNINRFYADSIMVSELEDSLFTSIDTSYSINSFTQKIPISMRLGSSYKYKKIEMYFEYVQGFKNSILTSTQPKFSIGCEYFVHKNIPIRIGFGIGGNEPWHFSYGIAFEKSRFEIGFAFRYYKAFLPNYSQGVAFSFGSMLKF